MIRIVHLSDIHMTKNGEPIWGVDVKRSFDLAIDKISEMKQDIDAIIVSGDISDNGSIESYQYVDSAFRKIGVPTYCCPGNHDNIEVLRYVCERGFIKIPQSVNIKGWKFIFLNSVVPDNEELGKNKARGYLDAVSLKELEENIIKTAENIVIVLHHPPIEPGGWLNRKLLDNREEFNAIIRKYKQVKLVMYGHTHYNLQLKLEGILYSSPSSIGFAFDKKLPKFEIAKGQEGYNVLCLSSKAMLCSNILLVNPMV